VTEDQDTQSCPKITAGRNGHAPAHAVVSDEEAFGYARDFLENQFVYLAISPRAGGLSIGVNVNPLVKCTFNCLYCEIDRAQPVRAARFDTERMAAELEATLRLAGAGHLRQLPRYAKLPDQLLQMRHVALSGDGEPTLADHFTEALFEINHLRTRGDLPFFKIVVVTNSTALDRPKVQEGLTLLNREDQVWAKLDGGTQDYLNRLNGLTAPIEKILDNILRVGRRRPVVIQSLFPAINGGGTAGGRDSAIRATAEATEEAAGANFAGANLFGHAADGPDGLQPFATKIAFQDRAYRPAGDGIARGSVLSFSPPDRRWKSGKSRAWIYKRWRA
jgi:hypothetical protein